MAIDPKNPKLTLTKPIILAGNKFVRFSPDGTKLATSSYSTITPNNYSGALKIWDSKTGKLLAGSKGHVFPISSINFSADGKWLLTTGADRTTKIWDTVTGRLLKSYDHLHRHPRCKLLAEFNPTKKQILAADGLEARLWDPETGNLLGQFGLHLNPIVAHFNYDGTKISTASDYRVIIWDINDDCVPLAILDHSSKSVSAFFSKDGNLIATCTPDDGTRIWNANTYELVAHFTDNSANATYAEFSADSKRILISANSPTIWDIETRERVFVLPKVHHITAKLNLDNSLIATLDNNKLSLWDVATGQMIGYPTSGVSEINFSPDGKKVAAASYEKELSSKIWDLGFEK